jgi:PadR family transcriptional regulator PadR
MTDNLGEFEVLVLTGVIAAGDEAYGMVIQEEVEKLAGRGRNVSVGAVYTTLGRLEEKGYVKAQAGEATAERGGRAKRYFKVTGIGQKVLRESLRPMRRAMDVLGGVEA